MCLLPFPSLFPSQSIRSRVMREIELTLRRGANLPHTEYGKDKVEEYKLEIQEILSVLNAPSSPLDENLSVGKRARLAPVDPQLFTVKGSGSKSGTSSALAQLRSSPTEC